MNILRFRHFKPMLHVVIWSILLAIPTVLFWKESWLGLTQLFFCLNTLYHIGFFYFNAYYLYPRLLTKKWWWLYIICIAVIVQLSYYGKIFLLQLNNDFVLTRQNGNVVFFSMFPFIIASIIFRLISDRLRFERLEKEARAQQLYAELKFLRSQVSPHFLFNMMTNMVSLARQQSALLEPSLIKLSDLLRYMLYDSTNEKILIDREIENIENYVALQQLRFGEDVKVTSAFSNNCDECRIEPMLMIPFIENSFKHGIGLVKEPFINISLSVKRQQLNFEVSNNFNKENLSKDSNPGIGLANVKNRLTLLYPGKYHLQIKDSDNVFSVQLKLNLA